jgi:hypothetical protein
MSTILKFLIVFIDIFIGFTGLFKKMRPFSAFGDKVVAAAADNGQDATR